MDAPPLELDPRALWPARALPSGLTLFAARADLDPAAHPDLLAAATPDAQEARQVLGWGSSKRRAHWMAGRRAGLALGLRVGWAEPGGDPPQIVALPKTGEPVWSQGARLCPLSLTHSGGWALAAAAPGCLVGLDYEVGILDQFYLTDRICSAQETARHRLLDQTYPLDLRRARLGQIWTLKEALLKAFGVGLVAELRHFEVAAIEPDGAARFVALHPLHEAIPHPLPPSLLACVGSFEGYPLALASLPR